MTGLGTRATETRDSLRATRTAAGDLGRTVTSQQARLESIIATQLDTQRALATSLHADALQAQLATQLHQQQAMLNLFALVPVRDVVPTMGGWAASADVVTLLVGELLRLRPRLVVECGSGVSTLWTALAIEHHGLDCRSSASTTTPTSPSRRGAVCAPTGSSSTWRSATHSWCRPSWTGTPPPGTTRPPGRTG